MNARMYFIILFSLSILPAVLFGQNKKEIGNLVMENIPDIPDSLKERMNQYQNARGASPSSWSANGESLLMTTRFGQTSQIHQLRMPLGARRQITFFSFVPIRRRTDSCSQKTSVEMSSVNYSGST
jgi:hypothetical protein